MAKRLVTCKKCGKVFDYLKTDGICPKCARYYSDTGYNEEEAQLDNILAPANEEKCSYHGVHDRTPGVSGHAEYTEHIDRFGRYVSGNRDWSVFSNVQLPKHIYLKALGVTILFMLFLAFILWITM